MNNRVLLKSLLALALAFQIPSQAFACRVGVDQQLFEDSPPAGLLAGAQIIRVHFSNARPAIDKWPRFVANPDGYTLNHTLIGVARSLDGSTSGVDSFPVYAFVTSCSAFSSMSHGEVSTVVDGEYYLIGRFASENLSRRFYAGGRRSHGGKDLYGGWHF